MKALILLLVFISFTTYAQLPAPGVVKVTDSSLARVLSNIESYKSVDNDNGYVIGIVKISNGPGSARQPETEEVSHSYWITVTEYDTYPEYHAFTAGPFYNAKIKDEGKTGDSGYFLTISYGPSDQPKMQRIVIGKGSVRLEQKF